MILRAFVMFEPEMAMKHMLMIERGHYVLTLEKSYAAAWHFLGDNGTYFSYLKVHSVYSHEGGKTPIEEPLRQAQRFSWTKDQNVALKRDNVIQ